jgi:LAGLIDADG DNA endonuclease family protein
MNMTKEYIAGFVQADGSFTAVVASKGNKSLYLSLSFTIVQNVKYKEVILEIQKIFGGIGN